MWQSKRWLGQHCTDSIEWSLCLVWPTRCWCLISQWLQENFNEGVGRGGVAGEGWETSVRLHVSAASRKKTLEPISSDKQLESVKKLLENNRKNVWISVEVYNYNTECGDLVLSGQDLVAKLANKFGKDLVIFLSPELANILVFHTHAVGILKLRQDDNENLQDVSKVAKCIRKEIKDMSVVKGCYPKRMNKSSASRHISDFLKALLRDIWWFVRR